MVLLFTGASGCSSKKRVNNIQDDKVIKAVVRYLIFFFLVGMLCDFFMVEKLFFEISVYIYSWAAAFGSLETEFRFMLMVPLIHMLS